MARGSRSEQRSADPDLARRAAEELRFSLDRLHELADDENALVRVRAAEALAKLAVRTGAAAPEPRNETLTPEQALALFRDLVKTLLEEGHAATSLQKIIRETAAALPRRGAS